MYNTFCFYFFIDDDKYCLPTAFYLNIFKFKKLKTYQSSQQTEQIEAY